jgi:hypothetical protein
MTNTYQPGVCNIGPAERRRRRLSGYFGLIVTVITLIAFVVNEVPDLLRVLVALPAGLAAVGFLQSAMHFCVNFAMRGLYNLGDKLGGEKSVKEKEQRRADQRKGLLILFYAGLIAAATVAIALLLP